MSSFYSANSMVALTFFTLNPYRIFFSTLSNNIPEKKRKCLSITVKGDAYCD